MHCRPQISLYCRATGVSDYFPPVHFDYDSPATAALVRQAAVAPFLHWGKASESECATSASLPHFIRSAARRYCSLLIASPVVE
jgi:hypothetical protein